MYGMDPQNQHGRFVETILMLACTCIVFAFFTWVALMLSDYEQEPS